MKLGTGVGLTRKEPTVASGSAPAGSPLDDSGNLPADDSGNTPVEG